MLDYTAIFIIGFLSSFGHCIGMCGGFVTAYTLKLSGPDSNLGKWAMLQSHLLYHLGRISTYGLLGALFGFTGEVLRVSVGLNGFQAGMQLFAGVIMVLLALEMGGWLPAGFSGKFPGYGTFKQMAARYFRKISHNNILGLGFVLGFIPCGLVYAAGAKAATSGGPISGMLTMLAFGLGTIPALFAIGISTQAVTAKFRLKIFRFATVLVVILGIATVYRGAMQLSSPQTLSSTQSIMICTH